MPSSDGTLRVVIPARFDSKRLPGKPLVDLFGEPMIVRVFHAVEAGLKDHEVVVAVDDARVLEALVDRGIPAVLTDPACPSGTDRVAEVARTRSWDADDLVINVQGDEPLIPPDLLSAFAEFCLQKVGLSIATIAVPITDTRDILDPNVVKVTMRQDGSAMTFSRASIPFDRDLDQSCWVPGNYRRHVGIYAYRNDALQRLTESPPCALEQIERLEQLRALWLNIPIQVMEWDSTPPGGVDTIEDVQRVSTYLSSRR